ncbi:MAG: arginine--tRNA ligase [Deltaproteobacteria bacterium RIFCSPLOWO2_02_FULL_44_10]|nr:MAG: arginine--tRNA ligase [Deltaproteobacteria bacterium RIFCSPHIGHO2_02_FULL_44_16]OGQ46656.1 MAG: arginine--tRNA ligase [Deltaproteobacteria bacterium RIFCSPLOWO2_02_FULL_44_10]
MEQKLRQFLLEAYERCIQNGELSLLPERVELEEPKMASHGDFATNLALMQAKGEGKSPRDIAGKIVKELSQEDFIQRVDIAGPGFINFSIHPHYFLELLHDCFTQKETYGTQSFKQKKHFMVEFVSANPTGPLHIGHGRGAVYGDVLANLFTAMGYNVTKEYYLNDVGIQMETLGCSVLMRLREIKGETVDFKENYYQGTYIRTLAEELYQLQGDNVFKRSEKEAIQICSTYAANSIFEGIKRDLKDIGVNHDTYFYEHTLHERKSIQKTFDFLAAKKFTYEKEGALWFCSTQFGDDKDRVLRKSDGSLTYFAADIAYHKEKYDRGFDRVMNVLGADHGGYVSRMKAAVKAFGYSEDSFDIVLIQLVNLIHEGKLVSMSTRSAQYETLRDVFLEVGKDVCRYFFLMRSHTAQLDFDLNLAKTESPENPVYYIQYAHARICSIFRKADELKFSFEKVDVRLLDLPEEIELTKMLASYPKIIQKSAQLLEPHRLAFYLLELSKLFQSYYSKAKQDERYRILQRNTQKTGASLYLLKNIQIVIQNGFRILGLEAPEQMTGRDDV